LELVRSDLKGIIGRADRQDHQKDVDQRGVQKNIPMNLGGTKGRKPRG